MPYDSSKRFSINIFNDGPAEGYGTHSSRMDVGRRRDVPYLKEMFGRTAAETCLLTPAMLKSFLIRYQGEEIALPAHTDVDDSVYGSLKMYQKEVCEELSDWVSVHGETALRAAADQVISAETDEAKQNKLRSVMEEISYNL